MSSESNIITNNKFTDNLLINFPFWFPLLYLTLIFNFPFLSSLILFSSYLLFAETHFASTWLFLFNKSNRIWFKDNIFKLFLLTTLLLNYFYSYLEFNSFINYYFTLLILRLACNSSEHWDFTNK